MKRLVTGLMGLGIMACAFSLAHGEEEVDISATVVFNDEGCWGYVGNTNLYILQDLKAGTYLFVLMEGATRVRDDQQPGKWKARDIATILDTGQKERPPFAPYGGGWQMAEMPYDGHLGIVPFPDRTHGRMMTALICVREKPEL